MTDLGDTFKRTTNEFEHNDAKSHLVYLYKIIIPGMKISNSILDHMTRHICESSITYDFRYNFVAAWAIADNALGVLNVCSKNK